MSECNHDCSNCKDKCENAGIQKEKQNEMSNIKNIIGVVSGKGGVGKSFVTSSLAVLLTKMGYKTAILDADITGPSIPKMFGIKEKAFSPDGKYLYPAFSDNGTKIMSMNLLLPSDEEPVVWRGPVIAGAVKQFYTEVAWDEVDFMFVDMPPGTGDVPLTVFQSIPVNGIIVVTSPQQLVSMIVEKAVNMAKLMNIPILSLIENFSYIECPDCNKKIEVFGKSRVEEISVRNGINSFAKVPINPEFANKIDNGRVEDIDFGFLLNIAENIIKNAKF